MDDPFLASTSTGAPSASSSAALLDGTWHPSSQIAYGIASASFLPVQRVEPAPDGVTVVREELNPLQVPLEVGDEVYVVEVFRPSQPVASSSASTTEDGVWFRGYVVSTAPHPRLPTASDVYAFPATSHAAPALAQDPQVSLGIFPASHVQIREHLAEDAERKLADLAAQADLDGAGAGGSGMSRSGSRGGASMRAARMEILQEEDEPDEDDTFNIDGTARRRSRLVQLAAAGSPTKSRNRSSVGSMATFAQQLSSEQRVAFQSSRLSQLSLNGDDGARPPPPLPNLKCGDETASGADEPLVDEIACALREWASLLYTHLYRREYDLFDAVREHINALHAARKQLLAQTLSVDESSRLRKEAVARLVQSNEQGLDVIVRHPRSGGLVDVSVDGEIDRSSWMSVVGMYAAQVALAHAAPMPEAGLSRDTPFPTPSLSSPSSAFHHVLLDVRQFAAHIAAPGENVELAFSLFSKTDARYITEEFCVVLNSAGTSTRDGPLRTLFRDLSQHDVSDQLYLVCRIVKNGPVKGGSGSGGGATASSPQLGSKGFLSPSASRSETASFDTSSSPRPHGGDDPAGMLFADASGRQSCRRPFGCAVLEISQLNARATDDLPADSADSLGESQMAIFVPIADATFSTLHEDIINSRIKEIEKHPRAEHVAVGVRILHGDVDSLTRQLPNLLSDVTVTSRLSFPDVVFPGDHRNDVYLKLWSGDFGHSAASSGAASSGGTSTVRSLAQLASVAGGGSAGSFEVGVEVRTRDGAVVERVLSRGAGEPTVSQYTSTVLRSNNNPTWGELVKLAVPVERMEECHLFFTFRNRTVRNAPDQPFAFAYFPLFPDSSSAFQADGSHTLVLYRYDKPVASPSFYFQVPAVYDASRQVPALPPSVSKTLFPLRDTMTIRSYLVSTTFTQNETLLRLLRWEQDLVDDPELMRATLTKLRFCSEVEVCKFLRDIFDALFGILVSPANQAGELEDLIFQAIVAIFGFVSDKRLTNFKPVLDLYISQSFSSSAAASHIVGSLQRLLRTQDNPEAATTLRSSIKVWKWLLRLVVRSREIQRTKEPGFGATASTLELAFKSEIASLLAQVNALMRATALSSIIGTQTLVVQHFPTILPELSAIFHVDELLEIAIGFVDSVGAVKGKMAVWKILCLRELVKSAIFASPAGRASLIPSMIRWLKPFLGKFDEYAMCSPKDPQATRDNARVGWIEGIRLATGVVAAMLDVVQEALADPNAPRDVLAQEHDNVEYLLALLPRLLEAYRELENLANLDAIERQRSPASIPAVVPVVFPASYPVSLLAYPTDYARRQATGKETRPGKGDDPSTWPTLRTGIGEIACVFLALIQLAPRAILVNWLESTMEVEGKDTFARQLGSVFRVARGILENEAFPADWLNMNALAHRVVLKLVEPAAAILERDFIPPPAASFRFNTALWRDFFSMLLELLASPQLLIEEFSPQKRRAIWRLAGDIRGEGAKILSHAWNAIAWPGERRTKHGLYQVQFVPSLVEKVLSLCLSHHDELRRVAVQMLHSMIVSEYDLNKHFAIIEAECVDKLDRLFGQQTKGDEISRAFFVAQLRQLFDEAHIDDDLRAQAASFLASIDSFLDLLLAVRNLPEGEEYQEDRIISTLKLMSFIRGIGRSEIFVRYVQRLVSYHAALGNHTEAGLTLKLHADLHEWDLATFVDPLPDLDLPRQTEFARKETLYMRILEHLGKGQAYETAIDLVKELEVEYERTYNYPRLAELLNLKAELYAHIAKSDRHFGNYFRVAFYGSRWPMSISGKQFIYRGQGLETLGSFIERMMNKHPTATLLRSSNIPSEDVQYGENQFLQITAVAPEVDHSSYIFSDPDVPHYVRAYYLHNEVNTFSFTRPLSKDPSGRTRSTNDFTSLWTEKTVLICEDSFPTVLRRSEIIEIRLIEISPVENAVHDVQSKQKELATLERRYKALVQSDEEGRKINSNPLSMALNGACDAPVNQGIPMYRRVFLQPEFIATLPPSQVAIVRQLETAIDELVVTLARCLKLHAVICPPEMQPFHETLERFFEKNFAAELARLPDQGSYEPASFGGSLSSHSTEPALSGPRVYGSLLIGSPSTTSLTAAAGGPSSSSRRESVSAHAMNDKVLLSHGAQTVPSGLTGAATLPHARAGSVSSAAGGRGERSASPTRSFFSTRSGGVSGAGGAGLGANGHANGHDGAATNGGPGRRASLLQTAVKKLGRRKGSEVAAVTEE
ncbi:Deoxycytidine kinase 1 [Rhodotorula kratochvilovae]